MAEQGLQRRKSPRLGHTSQDAFVHCTEFSDVLQSYIFKRHCTLNTLALFWRTYTRIIQVHSDLISPICTCDFQIVMMKCHASPKQTPRSKLLLDHRHGHLACRSSPPRAHMSRDIALGR